MGDAKGGIVQCIGSPLPGSFYGLAEGGNGKLYALPKHSEGHVIEIDPSSGTVREIGEPITNRFASDLGISSRLYGDLSPATDGCLYAAPCRAGRVLKIDPKAETVQEIGPNLGGHALYVGTLTPAPNGCLYAPPLMSEGRVLEINPTTGQVALIGDKVSSLEGSFSQPCCYLSFTLAQGGCLFAVPCDAQRVLKVDPWSRIVETFGEPIQPGATNKYVYSVLAKNGKLYAAPHSASHILEVDPDAGGVRQIGEAFAQNGSGADFFSTSGRKLWAVGLNDLVLEFEPHRGTQTWRKLQDILHSPMRDEQEEVSIWHSSCFRSFQTCTRTCIAGNGRAYLFPLTLNSCVLEFDPEVNVAHEVGEPLHHIYQTITTSNGRVFAVPDRDNGRIVCIDYLRLPKNPDSLQGALQKVLSSGEYSDVTICTSCDKTYRAHKLILVLRSRVFQSMFGTNMREARDAVVELGDVSPSVSDMFMQYLYSGEAGQQGISEQELCELCSLAHRYEIDGLVDGCTSLLQASISISSVVHRLKYADRLQCAHLKQACLDFIVSNQAHVVETDAWVELEAVPRLLGEVAEAMAGRRSKRLKLGDREFQADTDWTSLTWPQLRRACAERGLGQDGEKQALIERLQA